MTKVKDSVTDALIDQIESAARASFRRHRGSIRGQQLTAADNYDWHLLHAAYQAGHAAGVAAERKRCARLCARLSTRAGTANDCADAIRAGDGEQK